MLNALWRPAVPLVHEWTVAALNAAPGPLARRIRTSRVLSHALAPIVNRMVPDRLTEVVVRSGSGRGLLIVIEPKQEKFYWAGTHELEVQRTITESLSRGSVFWDVGAHCGFFSCLAGRHVGPEGSVVAFEPVPQNNARLRAAIRLNRLDNVVVRSDAVGANSGTVALHARDENNTMWTLAPEPGSSAQLVVSSVTLDDELERSGRAPDVVKVDVEGAEVAVLAGAAKLLTNHAPLLIMEFHADALLDDARALVPDYEFTPLGGAHWIAAPRNNRDGP